MTWCVLGQPGVKRIHSIYAQFQSGAPCRLPTQFWQVTCLPVSHTDTSESGFPLLPFGAAGEEWGFLRKQIRLFALLLVPLVSELAAFSAYNHNLALEEEFFVSVLKGEGI